MNYARVKAILLASHADVLALYDRAIEKVDQLAATAARNAASGVH